MIHPANINPYEVRVITSKGEVIINTDSGVIEAGGVKISIEMFQHLSDSANLGTEFRLIGNKDGIIEIERL